MDKGVFRISVSSNIKQNNNIRIQFWNGQNEKYAYHMNVSTCLKNVVFVGYDGITKTLNFRPSKHKYTYQNWYWRKNYVYNLILLIRRNLNILHCVFSYTTYVYGKLQYR